MEKATARNGSEDRLVPLLLLIVFIALGAWARVVNAGSSASLWFDEAWRIQRLLDTDSLLRQIFSAPNHIDPPVFSLAIYLLAQIHNTELVLRLVSIIPGVLAILAAYLVGRQLFTSRWTALLAAFLIAFCPWATVFSKELKPYSLGLLLHLSVLYGFLRYRRNPTVASTLFYSALMVPALFFSPNIVFAYPGILGLLLLTAWEKKNRRLFTAALGAGAVMFTGSVLYFFLFLRGFASGTSMGNLTSYWADHFCPGGSIATMVGWFFQRYLALFNRVSFSDFAILEGADAILQPLYPLMALAGALIVLARCRRRFLLVLSLFLLPVLVMILFNLAGLWPFGALRMNLFLVAYVVFPPLLLLDECQRNLTWADSFLPAGLMAALLMAFQFPAGFDDYARKRVVQRESSAALINLTDFEPQEPPIPLLANRSGMPTFTYYSRHHRVVSSRFRERGQAFEPLLLADKDSRLYTAGLLLRKCQEYRQVATYASHHNDIDRLLFRNDFSVAHHNFDGPKVHSCILSSEITGYEDEQKPLIPSKWFAGKSEKWKNLYISPPLPLGKPALGALVIINFDLKFNSRGKEVRFRFFDQDGSREAFKPSSIQNVSVRIPRKLRSAVYARIVRPVRRIRMVLAARGEYDFVIENVSCFVTRPGKERSPVDEGVFIPQAGDRHRVHRAVTSMTNFWPSIDHSYGWTRGDALIEFDDLEVDPERTVLLLETFGKMDYWRRKLINLSGLKVYLNGDRRARFLGPGGDPVRYYYFELPQDMRTLQTMRIAANTFNSQELNGEDTARALGIDLKSIQFPVKAEPGDKDGP